MEEIYQNGDYSFVYTEQDNGIAVNLTNEYVNFELEVYDRDGKALKFSREVKTGYDPIIKVSDTEYKIWLESAKLTTLCTGVLTLKASLEKTEAELSDGKESVTFETPIYNLKRGRA
jgi:hypothetical protein